MHSEADPTISGADVDVVTAVSVIVPVYRRTDWIGRCVEALGKQDLGLVFEVIIVDDGSPNERQVAGAVEEALHHSTLSAQFFRKENQGPAAARNFGAARSRGSILCFIDDDSVPERNWLKELTFPFQVDTSVAVVSGMIRSFDLENRFPLLLEKTVYSGRHWATCNIAYRREIFEGLGGFDEQFREASWEDNDLGLRAQWAGYRQFHCEKAVVFHPHEQDIEEYRQKCLLNGRGAAAFSRKYLFKKPLWALAAPVIMARNLVFVFSPSVIAGTISSTSVRFLWSFYSLRGFFGALYGKN